MWPVTDGPAGAAFRGETDPPLNDVLVAGGSSSGCK